MGETETVRRGARSAYAARLPAAHEIVNAYAAVLATPWSGVMLGVSVCAEAVTSVDFLPGNVLPLAAHAGIAREAAGQLQAYFRDALHRFSLPLEPAGTPFQRRVWDSLRRIPAGVTHSYGALASQLESSARSIGGACRANPIPIIIPCHRIVAAHGLGGFMGVTTGWRVQLKQRLLAHEFFSS